MATSFPPAQAHGDLDEVLPGVFFVSGSMKGGPLRFSRNMTVVREGDRLIVVNSVRLNDAGLAKLETLGEVTDVIRLAGFHGMDDPFYKDRYGAKVWAVEGQTYFRGLDPAKAKAPPYFEADAAIRPGSELPLEATLHAFGTRPPEGLLVLPREGGVAIVGDALQNWGRTDGYFNVIGKVAMKALGFIKPHNIGPGWAKAARPSAESIRSILDLEFEHLLPAHGAAVIGGAKQAFRPAIERFVDRRMAADDSATS